MASHPRKGEKLEDAAKRRLKEELGFACPLKHIFAFEYKADYDKTWGENEYDHVFIGKYNGAVSPDKDEVEELKFVDGEWLKGDVKKHPEKYTPWFKICFEKVAALWAAGQLARA